MRRERLHVLVQLLELLLGLAVALGRGADEVDELLAGLLLCERELRPPSDAQRAAIVGRSTQNCPQLRHSTHLQLEGDLDGAVEELGDDDHLVGAHRPRGDRSRADTDTAGRRGRGVTDDGVLVERDAGQVADLLDLGAGQPERAQVPQVEMVVRAVGLELVALLDEGVGDGARVVDDGDGVLLELGLGRLLERDGDAGDGLRRQLSS